jgi:hypothetical protein
MTTFIIGRTFRKNVRRRYGNAIVLSEFMGIGVSMKLPAIGSINYSTSRSGVRTLYIAPFVEFCDFTT